MKNEKNQNFGLSRRKQGFETPTGRQFCELLARRFSPIIKHGLSFSMRGHSMFGGQTEALEYRQTNEGRRHSHLTGVGRWLGSPLAAEHQKPKRAHGASSYR